MTIQVRATTKITEQNFAGKKLHVHARKGDAGAVVHKPAADAHGKWFTVTWARTGTTTDCHESEIRLNA